MVEKHGIRQRQSPLEKSIGKLVEIFLIGGGSIYGNIKEVEGRQITFNPYKKLVYNTEKGCNLYKFADEDSYLEVPQNGYFLEERDRETIEYMILQQNEEILKKLKEKDNSTK